MTPALAHDPGLSTLQLKILPERIEAELIFAQPDINTLFNFTGTDDNAGRMSFSEGENPLKIIARDALLLRLDDRPALVESVTSRFDELNNTHISVTFPAHLPTKVSVTSTLIERMPRGHRQFVSARNGDETLLTEVLLKSGQDTFQMDLQTPIPAPTFRTFFGLGVTHILTGYDHLLFLFALLCVTPSFRNSALIITSFTIAHSITLGAASLGWVNVESRYIEPLIAATIVYVGVENLIRRDRFRSRWLLTFAFGLIHGFGFASVLRELGISSGTTGLALPLLSFNLGVETGQMAIAALVLPIILAVGNRPAFARRWVPVFSTIVIVLGLFWFVERTLF